MQNQATATAPRTAGPWRLALLGSTVLHTALLANLPAHAQIAPNAAPTGGQVVAGQAHISSSANTTLIQQTTQRAAINWQSFNVGSQQTVQFQQPSSQAAVLNRVIGPDPSVIAGRITANGQVILINQSGVAFSRGSSVNAQSLVVSTANISNEAFMAGGKLHFDQPGNPNARIVNEGNITVGQAGLAALVAPSVVNSGVITARLGQVVLAGATTYSLDLYGDGLVAIDVTGQVKQIPNGPDGKPVTALVTNTGTIIAEGGTVTLTAAAADGLIKTLVSAGGRISADNANGAGGTLVVEGVGGSIAIDGALTATGQTGGKVQAIATNTVAVGAKARVDVSGKKGGGVVALGTTLARASGGPAAAASRTARTVTVATGAQITADATEKGTGGRVTVLSTGSTEVTGTITARGGTLGGDGGFVEVSGGELTLTGVVDVGAVLGHVGTLLLDPADLYISDAKPTITVSSVTATNSGSVGVTGNGASWVSTSVLQNASADVSLSASGTIFFASGTAGANTLNLGAHALAASGSQGVLVDRSFTIDASSISLSTSSGSVVLGSAVGGTVGLGTPSTTATVLNAGTAGTIALAPGGSGTIGIGSATSDVVRLSSGSSISLGAALNVNGTLQIDPGSASENVTINGSPAANTLLVSVAGGGTSTASGTVRVGQASGTTVTGITFGGTTDLGGANLALQTSGGVAEAANIPLTGVNVLSGSVGGTVALLGTANAITTVGSLTATGSLTILDQQRMQVAGPVSGSSVLLNAVGVHSISLFNGASVTATGATGGVMLVSSNGTIYAGSSATDQASIIASGSVSLTGALQNGTLSIVPSGTSVEAVQINPSASSANTLGITLAAASPTSAPGTLRIGRTVNTNVGAVSIVQATNLGGANLDIQSTGAWTQTGSLFDVGTLSGSAPTGVTLTTAGNSITALGSVTVGTGGLTLTNGGTFTVAGPVTADSVALTTSSGDVLLTGTLNATNGVSLNANGTIDQTGGTIGAATVTLTAGGDAMLTGTNNVGTLAASTAGGVLSFNNGGALLVGGSLGGKTVDVATTSGNVTLASGVTITAQTSGGAGKATITPGGGSIVIGSTSSDLATILADSNVNLGGVISGGTLLISPNSSSAVVLNGTSSNALGVQFTSGTNSAPGTVRIGQTSGTKVTTLGILAATNLGGDALDLHTSGAVTQATSGALTGVALLTGTIGSATLNAGGNSIVTLGAMTATNGLTLTDARNLSVVGPISAGSVGLTTSGSSDVTLAAGTSLSATNAMSLTSGGGRLVIGTASGDVATVALGTTLAVNGAIGTGTLQVSPGSTSGIVLNGTASAGTIDVAMNAGTNTATGTLRLGQSGGSSTVSNIIAVGASSLGGANLDIETTAAGAVTQGTSASAAITGVGTLSGSIGSGGITLASTSNAISTLGSLSVASGGGLTLADGSSLTVAGPAKADNISIRTFGSGHNLALAANAALQATNAVALASGGGTISVGASKSDIARVSAGTTVAVNGLVDGGILQIAPTASNIVELGGTDVGVLDVLFNPGAGTATGTVRIGQTSGTTVTSIDVANAVALGGANLDLETSGAVTQTASLTGVGTLSGSVGNLVLTTAGDSIATLGSLTASGGSLDLANAGPMTVAGPVSGAAISLSTVGNMTLADGAVISGTNAGSGSVTLDATGSLIVGSSTTSSAAVIADGQISLTGALTGGTLAIAPASAETVQVGGVATPGTLNVILPDLTGSTSTLRLGAGTGATTATTILFTGSTDLGGANLDLRATGGVSDSAPLTGVSTLSGVVGGDLVLTATGNAIGTLSAISAGGLLEVVDYQSMVVTGPLSGSSVVAGAVGGQLTLVNGVSITATGSAGIAWLIAEDTAGTIGGTLVVGAGSTDVASVSAGGSVWVYGAIDGGILQISPLSGTSEAVSVNPTVTPGTGTLSVGLVGSPGSTGTLRIGQTTGNSVTSIDFAGTSSLGGLNIDLQTTGAVTQSNSLTGVAKLSGNVGDLQLANYVNTIDTLGSMTATGTVAVYNGTSLSVIGPVSGSSIYLYTSTGNILLAKGATIASTGTASGSVLYLGAAFGSGAIVVGSTAGDVVNLTLAPTTYIYGAVETGTLEVAPGTSATVGIGAAPTSGSGPTVYFYASNTSGATGTVRIGQTANSTVAGIDFVGASSLGGANLDLRSAGAVTQSAALTGVATLTGSIGAGGASMANAGNAITTLGSMNSAGGFALTDGQALTVAGPVSATSVGITTTSGTLTLAGSVQGATVALSGASGLVETTGSVIGNGALTANSSAGSVVLGNTANAVASISGSAPSGAFIFADAGNAVNVGNVTAGTTAQVTAPTLTVNGLVHAAVETLTASAGTLGITAGGDVDATTSAALSGAAGITGSAGLVTGGGTLSVNSGSGAVNLGNTGNAVARVSGAAVGSFVFGDGSALSVGNVTAGAGGTVTITDTSSMTVLGTVGGASVHLAASGGTLAIAAGGNVLASASAFLSGSTGVLETGGAASGGTVTGGGALTAISSSGSVDLSDNGNVVGSVTGSGSGDFRLVNNAPLNVGAVTATAGVTSLNAAGVMTVSGPLTAGGSATLNAPTLALNGLVSAPLVSLVAGAGGIAGASGTIGGDGTLSAVSIGGSVDLSDTLNSVASVSGSAAGAFLFGDSSALTVQTVSASGPAGTASITGTAPVTVAGPVTAGLAATVRAPTVTLTGLISAPTISLVAGAGGIVGASGTVAGGGSLTATATGGSVVLTNGANAFTAVSGGAPGAFTLVDSNSLTFTGSLSASSVGLTTTAGDVTVAGGASVIGSTLVALAANAGSVTISGAVQAPTVTLTGSLGVAEAGGIVTGGSGAPGGAALTATSSAGVVNLGNPLNVLASIAGSSVGPYTVADNATLNVGNVSATGGSGTISIVDLAPITVSGPVTASVSETLDGPALVLSGLVSAPSVTLKAGPGGISGAGGTVAGGGALTAKSLGGTIDLTNGANSVGSISGSAAGSFRFFDAAALSVGSLASNGVLSLSSAGWMTLLGPVTAGGAATFDAPALTLSGLVSAPSLSFVATGGSILGAGGTVTGGGVVVASATGGGVDLSNGANTINSVSGSASSDFRVSDTSALTVGNVSAGGGATFSTAGAMTVSGPVTATNTASFASTGAMTVTGGVSGASATLGAGGSLSVSGPVSVVGAASFNAGTGMNVSGQVTAGGAATFASAAAMTIGGGVSANSATLGAGGALDLAGPVSVADAAAFNAGSGMTVSGPVTAGGPATFGAGGAMTLAALVSSGSTATFTAPTISFSGPINAPTVVLSGADGVSETGGGAVIGGGALSAYSGGGSVSLGGSNVVSSLSGSAKDTFVFTDTSPLTLGNVTAGTTATITAPALTVVGLVDPTYLSLIATSGTLTVAPGARVTSDAVASLSATDTIFFDGYLLAGSLGVLQSGRAITVAPGADLVAGGTLELLAPNISVGGAGATLRAPRIVMATETNGGSIAVASGSTLDASGGRSLNSPPVVYVAGKAGSIAPLDKTTAQSDGVYMTIGTLNPTGDPPGGHNGFTASSGTGSITLGDVFVGGPVLRMALPDNLSGGDSGSLKFGTLHSLGTPAATAVMTWIGNGLVNGTLGGQQLAVFFTSPNAHGDLEGALSNASGQTFYAGGSAASTAAGQGFFTGNVAPDGSFLQPVPIYRPNSKLQFGGCAISSINCRLVVVIQTPPLVALPPLAALAAAPEDDYDLLLPGISDLEY